MHAHALQVEVHDRIYHIEHGTWIVWDFKPQTGIKMDANVMSNKWYGRSLAASSASIFGRHIAHKFSEVH